MTRAERRAQHERIKQRVLRILTHCFYNRENPSPKALGVMVSTHCRPCSCWGCQNEHAHKIKVRARAEAKVNADACW
jgi:hypothetical protein